MIDQLQQLLQASEHLLSLAKDEAWDDFEIESAKYDALSQDLPSITWSKYDATMQSRIKSLLLTIQELHLQLLPLTQAWHSELQALLQNEVQARKLDEKYR
ncbi:flagellar protein FliT [Chitinibacter bivalviorum]|uniref:Flagellar protein FliT n=1 Tax=Chitinibacter bivalviorum TaxID=2739434 RepID=A0A7H9BHH0_9NEIS|nr:flagellar protein FliT [Chitinibacter bivalviorum]QLG87401.1 flagellar protein FliT [Chitinibacter bivalviorum]